MTEEMQDMQDTEPVEPLEPLEGERPGDAAVSWALHGLVVVAAAGAVALDRRVRRIVPSAPPFTPFVVSGAFYALLGVLEARRPYRRDWRPGSDEVLTDAAFLASLALAPAAGGVLSDQIRRRSSCTLGADRLPVPAGVALGVLAFDLGTHGSTTSVTGGVRRGASIQCTTAPNGSTSSTPPASSSPRRSSTPQPNRSSSDCSV